MPVDVDLKEDGDPAGLPLAEFGDRPGGLEAVKNHLEVAPGVADALHLGELLRGDADREEDVPHARRGEGPGLGER